MKKAIVIVALLLLFSALGGGGYYLLHYGLPGGYQPEQPPDPPVQADLPPADDLPVPQLAGDAPPELGDAVASLRGFSRTVKTKRAQNLAWEDAEAKMLLYDNDAIRTFERSSATIAFGQNDIVEVDQNALVVIKPRRSVGEEEEFALALLSPEFLEGLASKSEVEQREAIAAEAETRQIRVRRSKGSTDKSRIALKTLPDRSTAITSLSGTRTLVGPKGSEVVLNEKMVTTIGRDGQLAKPRALPGVPLLAAPKDGARFSSTRKAPQVEMSWRPVRNAEKYRVTVAHDRSFRKIFADETVRGTSFLVRNVGSGTYYWRVRAQDRDGFTGTYSRTRSFRSLNDKTPPKLTILFPPEMFLSPGGQVEMKGKTERGARVKVNGQTVSVGADGVFTHLLTLKEGVNLITIEASDAAGNFEYGRRVINYRGAKRSRAAGVSGGR